MNVRTLKILAGVVAILFVVYLITGRDAKIAENELLFPGLKAQINGVTTVSIQRGGESITVAKSDGDWTVNERDGYVADVGRLRELLIALADARIIEIKTSNPDKYHLLGVDESADGENEAVLFSIKGNDFDYRIIIGKTAQTKYRYARIPDNAQSVLIDQNPELPEGTSGWLLRDILDIGADRVARITIRHVDGEEILIEKESQDTTDYQVLNIPEGRELSYATVANGVGAALGSLTFDDVRASTEDTAVPAVVTTIETFDGLTLAIASTLEEETSWITVTASAEPSVEDNAATKAEAEEINGKAAQWQYKIPDYKANLLKRRFSDILKESD